MSVNWKEGAHFAGFLGAVFGSLAIVVGCNVAVDNIGSGGTPSAPQPPKTSLVTSHTGVVDGVSLYANGKVVKGRLSGNFDFAASGKNARIILKDYAKGTNVDLQTVRGQSPSSIGSVTTNIVTKVIKVSPAPIS